ncbi:MAG: type II toxin-antitoxin system HicA family toxin [Defluviitaleaceae bacterium]|nr:type II toxin-antitoxin system HicA family toxin [Defluviitaleaceae bacterium]
MSSKDLVKLAKRHGWLEKSQKGSHIKMVHPDREKPIIIPWHGSKDIAVGTLNSILKDLGLK